MLCAALSSHNKIDLVAAARRAVATKAGPGTSLWIHLHARGFIIMERAFQAVVVIWSEIVEAQDFFDAQAGFNFGYLHVKKGMCQFDNTQN